MYREVEGPGYVASKSWLLWTVDAWLLRISLLDGIGLGVSALS